MKKRPLALDSNIFPQSVRLISWSVSHRPEYLPGETPTRSITETPTRASVAFKAPHWRVRHRQVVSIFIQCKMSIVLSAFVFCMLISSCQQSGKADYNDNNCKLTPPFVGRLGFNTKKSYFSTSEKRTMGLVLLEAIDPQNLQAGATKKYQDSSWKKAGWLAPIQLDERGNVFAGPAPFINVLNNPAVDQNTIYKIDGQTGNMMPFLKLPQPDSLTDQNPYGIIGMVYLCESGSLYVSSIAGSNRQYEKGAIYQVDIAGGKIKDELRGIDVLGMGIAYSSGERRLFFGKARTPDVYSVTLDKKGAFTGSPQFEFSMNGLGPRGDDKVRRIKTAKNGSLDVYGMEFNFNLIAPSEKQETVYHFVYDEKEKKWLNAD